MRGDPAIMLNKKYTKREVDILETLWDEGKPLSVNEIADTSGISKNTVAPILKKILDKHYIKVEEVFYSAKSLTRKFLPLMDREKFILDAFQKIHIDNFLNHYLDRHCDQEILDKLEAIIQEKRDKLQAWGQVYARANTKKDDHLCHRPLRGRGSPSSPPYP